MAYEPTNWQTGDTITAEKLNKLENGVAFDFIIREDIDAGTLSADGLSLEEMIQKGASSLRVGLLTNSSVGNDISHIFSNAFLTITYKSEEGVSSCTFRFLNERGKTIILNIYTDGTAELDMIAYTFTYSNGHYTFTPSN